MYGKIFFIFFIFEQKIISQTQKQKTKHDQNITQWARGCIQQKGGVKNKKPKPSPKSDFIFNLCSQTRVPCTQMSDPAYVL